MSGFSVDWLSLREPVDHRSRDAGLLARLGQWAASRRGLTVLDLGSGTGSNARAMIPHLPGQQDWWLVDYDGDLLAAGHEKLAAFLGGEHVSRALSVSTQQADLSLGIAPLLGGSDCDLVTASALFDLASMPWLDGMVAALAARRLPLYTVLIYDGVMDWVPEHPLDAAIRSAFNAHQQRDKGFGPAAGPHAGVYLAARLTEAGYDVTAGASPWVLGPEDEALMLANLEGIAVAADETGLFGKGELANWLAFRRKSGRCTVGHVDLLALPN